MINNSKYEKLLNDGLSLDHLFVLMSIYNKEPLSDNKRIKGFYSLLEKRGFIKNGDITSFALKYIDTEEKSTTLEKPKQGDDFAKFTSNLHQKLQDELVRLTGKKQKVDKIKGKGYSFLPNVMDLTKILYKVVLLYKLSDQNAIEKCLLSYINKCHKAQNWFPVLQYYIYKDNKSQLVTDLESIEDNAEETAPDSITDTFINI